MRWRGNDGDCTVLILCRPYPKHKIEKKRRKENRETAFQSVENTCMHTTYAVASMYADAVVGIGIVNKFCFRFFSPSFWIRNGNVFCVAATVTAAKWYHQAKPSHATPDQTRSTHTFYAFVKCQPPPVCCCLHATSKEYQFRLSSFLSI